MSSKTLTGAFPDDLPSKEDGSPYPFVMAFDQKVVLADTRAELAAALIGDYPGPQGSADAALMARYLSCVAAANGLQARLAADALEAGVFDPQTSSEPMLTILFSNRYEKVEDFARWDHEVPLVLVASGYAPYLPNPRPEGRIIWLDPYTETTYLDSMAEAGVIRLHVHGRLHLV